MSVGPRRVRSVAREILHAQRHGRVEEFECVGENVDDVEHNGRFRRHHAGFDHQTKLIRRLFFQFVDQFCARVERVRMLTGSKNSSLCKSYN